MHVRSDLLTKIGHFIHGRAVAGSGSRFSDVFNPATGEVEGQLALANNADLQAAVDSAKQAQPGWAARRPR